MQYHINIEDVYEDAKEFLKSDDVMFHFCDDDGDSVGENIKL